MSSRALYRYLSAFNSSTDYINLYLDIFKHYTVTEKIMKDTKREDN